MKKNRVKIYWLLLLVLIYGASMILSAGEAQARYENTITKSMVLNYETAPGITSNCLVSEEESPVTVLLGELPLQRATTVSFWLHSNGGTAAGNLLWEVVDDEDSNGHSHAEYLDITMYSGYEEIDPNTEIDLLDDVTMDISMVIRPTDIARNTEHEKLNITVLVSWGEDMWGTFQLFLPEVKLEVEETAPEENPEEEPSEGAEEAETSEADGTAPTTGTTQNQTNQASYMGMYRADQPDTGDENIDTELPDEDSDLPSGNEGNGESEPDNREDPDLVNPDGATGEKPAQKEEPLKPIRIETITRFDPAGVLPVKLVMTPDVTAIRLGIFSGELEDETVSVEGSVDIMEPFQNGTRFSLDGGECFYMMYKGSVVEFSVQGMTSLTLLLDLTYTDFQKDQNLTLVMETYAGEGLLETCIQKATADAQSAFQVAVLDREDLDREEETRAAARAAYREDGIILDQNNALEMLLPMEWQKMDLEYELERLTMTDFHTLSYVPVSMSENKWTVDYVNENNHHYLTLQTGNTLPQAGTYRLILNWTYEGICYTQTQTTFFINYSAQTDYQLISSEVPQND